MNDRDDGDDPLRVDWIGVGMIAALVVVVGPTTIFTSAWILTSGLDLAASSTFELIVAVIITLLALLMIHAGVRELRGGLGVRVDERGVRQRGIAIAWAEIEALASPDYGLLEIRGAGKLLRLRTYLYAEPKRLIAMIVERSGKSIE